MARSSIPTSPPQPPVRPNEFDKLCVEMLVRAFRCIHDHPDDTFEHEKWQSFSRALAEAAIQADHLVAHLRPECEWCRMFVWTPCSSQSADELRVTYPKLAGICKNTIDERAMSPPVAKPIAPTPPSGNPTSMLLPTMGVPPHLRRGEG